MDISNIVSVFSMVIAGGALALSLISTLKKGAKEDSAQIARMMTMLDSLTNDMKEIKDDFRRDIVEMKTTYQADHDKLTIVERDLKSCFRRYDELSARVKEIEK